MKRWLNLLIVLFSETVYSLPLLVVDQHGSPVAQAMVTIARASENTTVLDDMGYVAPGVTAVANATETFFSNNRGEIEFNWQPNDTLRVRKDNYVDQWVNYDPTIKQIVLIEATESQRVDAAASNLWLSQVNFGDEQLKSAFQLNCAFCHQQASVFMRNERTHQQWLDIFARMNSYGARLPEKFFEPIANVLIGEYQRLRAAPNIPKAEPWQESLSDITMHEMEIGDGFSQMHDLLLHPNGKVYVGDNLFDRIYEIDPQTNNYQVYKVPALAGAQPGGFLGNRFKRFPKIDNTMGVHSFAVSPRDGHIFITPSMQQALIEFDPDSKRFTLHEMPSGFYPHTIRIDAEDRVWFTLALSSQVAMFDRQLAKFTLIDLPARNTKEAIIINLLPMIFAIPVDYRPQPAPDEIGTGLPMPYGIDIDANGGVWVARLYANDLAYIDPTTHAVTMIDFPYGGPRRLRCDADGNVWIVAFQEGLLVKYDPSQKKYTSFELPVINEIPYALNVDKVRGQVWVNGNQSDTLMRFDIADQSWLTIPLPRARFFSRDVEIDEATGAVYTTNSHFPIWQTEGGLPSLVRIDGLGVTE